MFRAQDSVYRCAVTHSHLISRNTRKHVCDYITAEEGLMFHCCSRAQDVVSTVCVCISIFLHAHAYGCQCLRVLMWFLAPTNAVGQLTDKHTISRCLCDYFNFLNSL